MSGFIFTVGINSKLYPAVRSVQETYLPKFSETSDVRYWVNRLRRLADRHIRKAGLDWKV